MWTPQSVLDSEVLRWGRTKFVFEENWRFEWWASTATFDSMATALCGKERKSITWTFVNRGVLVTDLIWTPGQLHQDSAYFFVLHTLPISITNYSIVKQCTVIFSVIRPSWDYNSDRLRQKEKWFTDRALHRLHSKWFSLAQGSHEFNWKHLGSASGVCGSHCHGTACMRPVESENNKKPNY